MPADNDRTRASLPRLLDARAVADALACSLSAARRIMRTELVAYRIGDRLLRVTVEDLAEYVKRKAVESKEPS